jgi:acyl carrier protein
MTEEKSMSNTVSTASETCQKPRSVEEVSAKIRFRLEERIAADFPQFDEVLHDQMSFDYIGLDSASRVELLTTLAADFGVRLDPTAAYDFVTIGSLAEFVWSRVSGTELDEKRLLEIG